MTAEKGNKDNKSVRVSYIGDLAYSPPDGVFLVESDSDYVRVCKGLSLQIMPNQAMADQAMTSHVQRVWVRSKNHFAWLRDFTKQIGCPADFEEKTARLVLAEQWDVVIPDWLCDADVLEQNLLGLKVDPKHWTSFANRLLTHIFESNNFFEKNNLGCAFRADTLDAANLADVVSALVSSDTKAAFKRYPVLYRCIEAKCEEWKQGSDEDWVREVCGHLLKHAFEVWQWLSFWALLHGYPEKLLEYVLSPQQIVFVKKIPVESLNILPLEPDVRDQALTQIEIFFKDIRSEVTSSEELQKVVDCMSGRLFQEYKFISRLLTDKRFPATVQDVQKVQAKFRLCPGVNSSQLSSLISCVRPKRPALLSQENEWTSQEWIRWTVEEYTPYRNWQIYNRCYDEELEQTVKHFSEWYLEEYAAIHKDSDLSLIYALNKLMAADSKNEFSIVLLVDCLPVHFMGLLEDALCNAGYSRHHLSYRFAPLPTTTECSKGLLLRGGWQDADKSYEAILKIRSASDWDNKRVVYLSNLKALSELSEMPVSAEPGIAVLNLVDGDELLHSDMESKNVSYEEEMHSLFTRMVEVVSRLSDAWTGSRELFSVYVITDHGACRILEEEKESFDSKIVNKLFPDEKHRFAAVNEEQVDNVPENLWVLGHRFKQPFISEKRVYFLPNGHSTVRGPGKAKGYLHGGATPEEVIVPIALYKLVKAAWKAPVARFLNLNLEKGTARAKFYIQRVVTLEIEIQNPNCTAIRILRASVLSPETDIRECENPMIQAEGVNTLRMSCYFQKAALEEKCLEIKIAYEIAGETRTLTLTLESEFKSAMPTGFSLRNL